MDWFTVDKSGLAKLIEKQGRHRAVFELIQNAWDQRVTEVRVSLKPIPNRAVTQITVTDDDPDGFQDLSHAFTLFAESTKKGNPEQRGRFNLGEKFVLALCNRATIKSTTGSVIFDEGGRRQSRIGTVKGSIFDGEMRMSRDELSETMKQLLTLIPPGNIKTRINGEELVTRTPICTFEATLPTDIADDEGYLRRTKRKTKVEVFEVRPGEEASIYELGIPVVPTGDKYHVNIMQKVPLNTDRDNVTPGFLQELRTLVFNNVHTRITEEDASSGWVRAATSDERCSPIAMSTAMDKRFGKKRVIFDPSDPEANNKAFAAGYNVITGSQLNRGEWGNVKTNGLALPAGQVTPAKLKFDGSIPPVHKEQWTQGMTQVHEYTRALARALMGIDLQVAFLDTHNSSLLAYYSRGERGARSEMVYYVKQLGPDWFDLANNIVSIDDLIIHEFGHESSSNHLSSAYHDALSLLGAKLKQLALMTPEFFNNLGVK